MIPVYYLTNDPNRKEMLWSDRIDKTLQRYKER